MGKTFNKVVKKKEKSDKQLQKELYAKCIPIAQEIFKIAFESGCQMGDGNFAVTRPKEYVEASKRIMQMMVDADLEWMHRQFVFQLALQPITHLQNVVMTDLSRTFEYQISRVFGVSSFNELTMSQIEEGLVRISKPLTPEEEAEIKRKHDERVAEDDAKREAQGEQGGEEEEAEEGQEEGSEEEKSEESAS